MATGFQLIHLKAVLFIVIATAASVSARGQNNEPPARRIGIIFEGSFERAEIAAPITGARKTQLVAFYEWDFGVRQFTEATWKERGLDWDRLLATARTGADKILGKIEPELVRDPRGVILYAVIADKDPFLTSILLSPKLLERFRDALGDRIQIVLIDRHRIYLFPATGGQFADYGSALVNEFRRTRFPVSLEVLLLDEDGYRVIGELDRAEADDPPPQLNPDPSEGEPSGG